MTHSDPALREPVRVLCLAACPLQASLLSAAIDCRREVETVGCTAELEQARGWLPDVDVVVLQPARLVDGGLTWIRTITEAHPGVRLVVAGVPPDEPLVVAYVEAGALGCVTEDEDADGLAEAILAVQRGHGYIDPKLAPALLRRLTTLRQSLIDPQTALNRLDTLTAREHEVLGMMTRGCANGEIAARLGIALGTVKNHVHNILHKLQARDRWEAAACAEVAARGGALDQIWPLTWVPWPAMDEVLADSARAGEPAVRPRTGVGD
jgi:DNA-binding NarL/FixJ family response regulator